MQRIGERLCEAGVIDRSSIDDVLAFQEQFGGLFGQACLKLGLLREDDLLNCLSDQLGLTVVGRDKFPDVDGVRQAVEALGLPASFSIDQSALVWTDGGQELFVVARNPLDYRLQEQLQKLGGYRIHYLLTSNRDLDQFLQEMVRGQSEDVSGDRSVAGLRQLAEQAPVIDFVNGLFADALDLMASDIHVEPDEFGFRTRFRIDGVLGTERTHPRQIYDAVSTRIKILSGMDIAERRLPQDGRQGIRIAGQEVDLRVSTLPGGHGESIVIRLLRKKQALPPLQSFGMSGTAWGKFQSVINEPNGVVLVTGPTGSGKSTTLYKVIEDLNNGERKIITIEDPIEYEIDGVTQVHARSDIGLTFAAGLRSMLRQDPDVIMVGEIRDGETATIAIQSALTGHLVLSTLHTNSAFASIERLLDLGIEPFLVEAALKGVVGQRLLRKNCPDCFEPGPVPATPVSETADCLVAERSSEVALNWGRSVGCPACHHTGYRGRMGVFEVLDMASYGEILLSSVSLEKKHRALREAGFRTMKDDGLVRAALGQTSLEEVERVFGPVGGAGR